MHDMKKSFLILHNIRSVQNVGAIFRTADASGVSKVFLSGYTPGPLDRFGRVRNDFKKASLGAEEFVSWEQIESLTDLFKKLRADGVEIIALEQHEKSQPYNKVSFTSFALVLGNETDGVDFEILNTVDTIIEIPMSGKKESLNVSVAAGIALFRLLEE